MNWVLSSPVYHKTGLAQEASIITWKWYIENRAKAGKVGVASLHEQIAMSDSGTDSFSTPKSKMKYMSPIQWG